ncbi:MAG: nucleotidyltransferase family protein [Oscillospiraceae bacterium]|nr:nucleotidyltransferase family protein [Oscillospiraceae bacterium]
MLKISAIILAAGLSERMGTDKLMLMYKDKFLLQHSLDLLNSLPVFERIAVTATHRLEKISLPPGVKTVINLQPEKGQSESIRLGLKAASGTHFLFMPADQPELTLNDLTPLINAAAENPDKIIYPVIGGEPSSPTIFPQSFRTALTGLSGDTGGWVIREANKERCVGVEVENSGNFIDIDFPEDLENN